MKRWGNHTRREANLQKLGDEGRRVEVYWSWVYLSLPWAKALWGRGKYTRGAQGKGLKVLGFGLWTEKNATNYAPPTRIG